MSVEDQSKEKFDKEAKICDKHESKKMSTSTPTEVDPEHKHYKEIIHSFRDYANWMSVEAARRERHLANLSDKHKALLPSSAFDAKLEALRLALATNAAFLNFVADEQDISGFGLQFHHDHDHSECDHEHHNHGGDSGHSHGSGESNSGSVGAAANSSSGSTSTNKPTSSPSHYSKVKSTLHQLVRDWSAEGAAERDASYAPLITELQRALPVTPKNKNKQRVLVPGCGLGRLMYDLCAAGYAAQGNEFSLQMLFTAHVMLNVVSERECVTIHPWIHDASNHLRAEDMLRPVHVPDVVPAKLTSLNPGADMSMTAGEDRVPAWVGARRAAMLEEGGSCNPSAGTTCQPNFCEAGICGHHLREGHTQYVPVFICVCRASQASS